MKKALWITVAVIVGFLSWTALRNFQTFGLRARRAEGKLLARKLVLHLKTFKENHGRYPDIKEIKVEPEPRYRWGTEHCSDCGVGNDSYKLSIYGNIDEDPEMDIMHLSHESEEVIVIADDSIR